MQTAWTRRILLAILISTLIVIELPSSIVIQAQTGEAPYEFSLDLQTYKSTKITFNFPYTNQHSITDITTVGQSSYRHEGSGTHLTFIGEDIDIYSFTVILGYENETAFNNTKNVLIGVWSGLETMDGYTITSDAAIFVVHVRLSLTEQPSYPSSEEVSEAVVHKIEQDLVQQTEMVNGLVARVETLQYINMVILAVMLSTVVCIAIVVSVLWRRRGVAHV